MSEIEILLEFKSQLITFLDELISQFPREGDLVVLRIFIANQVLIKDAMNEFNHAINKEGQQLKRMAKERNERFFIEHNVFEEVVGNDKSKHFKKMWCSGLLDDEDKQVIWNWIDVFIYLADKYSKVVGK